MKLILLGNSGAGKSTLANKILEIQPAARLSLDEIAFEERSTRRLIEHSLSDVRAFISNHQGAACR